MLSKLLRQPWRTGLAMQAIRGPLKMQTRKIMGLIPPNQYDVPIPTKLQVSKVVIEYWETIPLFFCTYFCFAFVAYAFVYAANNKMDLVFSTHSRNNISRTMDLRNPTVHKVVIINQKYKPWPEMQDVLDKMAAAEKRALARLQTCNP